MNLSLYSHKVNWERYEKIALVFFLLNYLYTKNTCVFVF